MGRQQKQSNQVKTITVWGEKLLNKKKERRN